MKTYNKPLAEVIELSVDEEVMIQGVDTSLTPNPFED